MNTQIKTGLEKKTVAVALSGGIDSALTAKILSEEHFKIFAITMQVFDDITFEKTINNAKRIAGTLKIDSFTYDIRKEFEELIINPFCKSYLEGLTPNPCVECNRYIKFELLLDKAMELGADYLATGHYSIVLKNNISGEYEIKKGIDTKKEQSYFLWKVSQERLKNILMPLGNMKKEDVKAEALKTFPFLSGHKESQDICFPGDKTYMDFLVEKTGIQIFSEKGRVINKDGQVIGYHKGFPFYTIGQRKGFGVSHTRPLYVLRIIPEENIIVVGEEEDLICSHFYIRNINFISHNPTDMEFKCNVKIRYNSQATPATVLLYNNTSGKITFLKPQKAVTPGQSAVFYIRDNLVGGGIII